MRIIGTALTLAILALLAVWYLPTMYWGYQISREMARAQAGDDEGFKALGELTEGPPLIAWLKRNKNLNRMFNPTELTRDRYVSYAVEMPFEDLMQPGEALPDPEFRELYASARAPRTLIAYCPEVLQHLGVKCDVSGTTATISRDGMARLKGQLHYVPSYELGDPSAVSNGKLVSVRAQLINKHDLRNTPENRAIAFGRALEICSALRELVGNCAVSAVRLDSSQRGEFETLRASASFGVFADSTQYRRDSLQSEVDAIVDHMLN